MVNVHRAGLDDVPGIAAVHISSWEGAYRGVVPDAWFEGRTLERQARLWSSVISDPDRSAVWVGRQKDGPVIGFCHLALPGRDPDAGPRTAEVGAMYVEPERWGEGAGRMLIDAALAFLTENAWREVTLWVLEDNARARGFYEACGFTSDGSRQRSGATGPHGAGAGHGPGEIRMRRLI